RHRTESWSAPVNEACYSRRAISMASSTSWRASSGGHAMLKLVLTFVLVALSATAATADPAEDRVRAVIAEWYAELVRLEKGNAYRLTAPGYIDASPHYEYVDTGSAALGPRVFTSLAATALQFE